MIAPAPSPKRMHVPRSSQSVMRESTSAPITITVVAMPELICAIAWLRAYAKPAQAASMSMAPALCAPMSSATSAEIDGNERSGEAVAVRIRSISAGAMSARSTAWRAAMIARSVTVWSSRTTRRSAMPVRSRIHASSVSTRSEISSLVTMRSGIAAPTPMIATSLSVAPITRAAPRAGRTSACLRRPPRHRR